MEKNNRLIQILIDRDHLTKDEAIQRIRELKILVRNGSDPEELLYEIGLEPDYIWDLL